MTTPLPGVPSTPSDEPALPRAETTPILDLALSMVESAVPSRGTLVDAPCGSGYLAMKAVHNGWTVRPVDLFPMEWRGDPALAPLRADLNGPVPLETASADALVCCEGLEHLECPFSALREFRRIVRPGGVFVVSIPNTLDIRQRWRMFRSGHWSHYFPSRPEHVNHMGTFVLACTLIRDGWTVEAVRAPKKCGAYLAPLVPFFRLGADSRLPEDVRRMLSTREVLLGRTVVLLARNESAAAVPAAGDGTAQTVPSRSRVTAPGDA